MAWRLASALDVLRAEINSAYPNRSKISDGTIGDAAHQSQGSASDHNPWISGVGGGAAMGIVSALDITTRTGDDPGDALAELVRRDPRTKYVIRDGRIAYGGQGWEPYYGSDPHDTHMHISVRSDPDGYDSTAPWGVAADGLGGALTQTPQTVKPVEDDDMQLIQGPDRGIALVGPGYFRALTDNEEVALAAEMYGDPKFQDNRKYDVAKALALGGRPDDVQLSAIERQDAK